MRRTTVVLLTAALGLATVASAEVKMVPAGPRSEKAAAAMKQRQATIGTEATPVRERWVGTRAIIFDNETRKLRTPSDTETATMVRSLRQMFARPAMQIRTQADGTRQGHLNGAVGTVVVARATEEGATETMCVESFSEAANFLGLVQKPASSEK
jgi:hypothetical protein